MSIVNRGFGRRRPVDPELGKRIPPGQHRVPDFAVLSAGPTPAHRVARLELRGQR